MSAHRNRPRLPPYVSLPQCDAPMVENEQWNKWYLERRRAKMARAGLKSDQCPRGGTVNINGKNYCGQHGGILALAMLLGEEVVWAQYGDKEQR